MTGSRYRRGELAEKRETRFRESVRDCDPNTRRSVMLLSDQRLLWEGYLRSGLTQDQFFTDVLFLSRAVARKVLHGLRPIGIARRLFLRRELIRARHRAKHGQLPETTWCTACGRGTAPVMAGRPQDTLRAVRTMEEAGDLPEGSTGLLEALPEDRVLAEVYALLDRDSPDPGAAAPPSS